jgi:hypothetical protein
VHSRERFEGITSFYVPGRLVNWNWLYTSGPVSGQVSCLSTATQAHGLTVRSNGGRGIKIDQCASTLVRTCPWARKKCGLESGHSGSGINANPLRFVTEIELALAQDLRSLDCWMSY